MALVLVYLARRAGLRPLAAGVTATVASVPALLYAYALMGSIKELTALPELMLMGALAVGARDLRERLGLRALDPFAIAAAAALDAIGIAATPWVGLFALAALIAAVPIVTRRDLASVPPRRGRPARRDRPARPANDRAAGKALQLAEGVSSSNATAVSDPGNLLRPLKFIQAFGVWLGETHRSTRAPEPDLPADRHHRGLHRPRPRLSAAPPRVGGARLRRLLADRLGLPASPRDDMDGREAAGDPLARRWCSSLSWGRSGLCGGRRLEGVLLVGAVTVGVLASDAFLYHATNLAPTARYSELALDRRPATPARARPSRRTSRNTTVYLLRDMEVDLPGAAYAGQFSFVPGSAQLALRPQLRPRLDRAVQASSVSRRSSIAGRRVEQSALELRAQIGSGAYYSVWTPRSWPARWRISRSAAASSPRRCPRARSSAGRGAGAEGRKPHRIRAAGAERVGGPHPLLPFAVGVPLEPTSRAAYSSTSLRPPVSKERSACRRRAATGCGSRETSTARSTCTWTVG